MAQLNSASCRTLQVRSSKGSVARADGAESWRCNARALQERRKESGV